MTDVLDPAGLAAPHVALLVLRVLVGVPFSLHGFQKLFGWFGGGGLAGTAGWFRSLGFGDGRAAAVAAGTAEVLGGLGLALGLLTPLAAAAVAAGMTTAAFVNNAEHGFWSVRKGWELNGYLVVVAVTVALAGPGRYSLDHLLGLTGTVLGSPWAGLAATGAGIALGAARWFTRRRT